MISGDGELIEPDDGVIAIGSGGAYALAAAPGLASDRDSTVPARTREAAR